MLEQRLALDILKGKVGLAVGGEPGLVETRDTAPMPPRPISATSR
jgi:hypothetical protein